MQRKSCCLLGVVMLALGLAACQHNPGIIKYPAPMAKLKQTPHDTTREDKRTAAQTHTQLAVAYMQQGHLKEAEKALRRALKFDDKYVPAHTMLAILDWRINRLKDANREFRAAIALDPSNGDANNNYGRFLCEQGKREEAMGYFRKALADPFYKTPVVANTNAGKCLLKASEYSAAEPYLHKALEIDSHYGIALLAMAKLDYDKGSAFDARGYLQQFEAADKATAASLLLGYRIATRLGDKETATDYSNRLEDQFPDSTQAQSLNGSGQ